MEFNPDPEQILQAITRIQDAYQAAADNVTGPSKPSFEKLSAAFNKAANAASTGGSPDFGALLSFALAVREVSSHVRKGDAEAASVLQSLADTVKAESQTLLGGLAGGIDLDSLLGGLGGGGFGGGLGGLSDLFKGGAAPEQDTAPDDHSAPKRTPKPRKPKADPKDFKLG